MSGMALDLLLIALTVAFTMFVVLNFGGILTWVERKQPAIITPYTPSESIANT